MSEWISVGDGMPEQGEIVTVWSATRDRAISKAFWDRPTAYSTGSYWGAYVWDGYFMDEEIGDLFEFKEGEITHWMKAEPPK